MRRVVFNKKGGVGKSTIACNLAALNAAAGRRTLVVDLDHQCNTSQYLLGTQAGRQVTTAADYFESLLLFNLKFHSFEACIHPTPFKNLYLVPASPALEELESKLESRYKMYKLRDVLSTLPGYDDVYIDTPPALNFYTRSALIASERCLIPFDCDAFSRQAVYALMDIVREIREDHNADLSVEGVVVNQYQARASLPLQLVSQLKKEGLPVLDAFLSSSVKVRESHDRAKPLIHLAPRHKLTQEFIALYRILTPAARLDLLMPAEAVARAGVRA